MRLLILSAATLLAACSSTADATDATDATPTPGSPDTTAQFALGPVCGSGARELNTSPKVSATSAYKWSCTATTRTLTGNGIPNHPVTTGNFATPIGAQSISVSMKLSPSLASAASGNIMTPGYVINSVKLDPATDGSCAATATSTAPGGGCVAVQGRDPWRLEAIGGAFQFGTDESNAHVQPNGQYHYHGMPVAYLAKLNKGATMTLVGYAIDGFPIYARYGYTVAGNATSGIKEVTPSWRLKATPDAGRPSAAVFPMGTFTQDYAFVAGSGDLDECNGRTGVTPEYPAGIYHYYITATFPYIQRCVKGTTGT
jgi:hypothetical protein